MKVIKLGRCKRGSYILEAAIVLPVIMLVMITTVMIIMFFYSQMTERCKLHVLLRQQAGEMSGTTKYIDYKRPEEVNEFEIYRDKKLVGGNVYGRKNLIMQEKGVLYKRGTFVIEGSTYSRNGTDYVRYINFVKGKTDE